jgi:hypothetical protein
VGTPSAHAHTHFDVMHFQGSPLVMGNIKMCLGTPQTHARQATRQPGKRKPDCPFLLGAITSMCTYNVGG